MVAVGVGEADIYGGGFGGVPRKYVCGALLAAAPCDSNWCRGGV